MDIASSNFSEVSTIFGGGSNLMLALANITEQYKPSLIGVATTCLSETIGDDVGMRIQAYLEHKDKGDVPLIVQVSTPSYCGTHMDGFHRAVYEVVRKIAVSGLKTDLVTVFPGFLSCADIRHLKEIIADFQLAHAILPDYSDSLDGQIWDQYHKIPAGGISVSQISDMGRSKASLELGYTVPPVTASQYLDDAFQVPRIRLGLPIGINETDQLMTTLKKLSGSPTIPTKYAQERGRLIDAYVDGHKYVFGKRVIAYGEEDLVIGLAAFLAEIGVIPIVCASGGTSGKLEESISKVIPELTGKIVVHEGVDFMDLARLAEELKPDFLIGNSKGYALSRNLGIPLIRVGFPIHDRFGGQRLLHVGYRGAQQLFDAITNAVIARKQDQSQDGYSYL